MSFLSFVFLCFVVHQAKSVNQDQTALSINLANSRMQLSSGSALFAKITNQSSGSEIHLNSEILPCNPLVCPWLILAPKL